MFDLANSVTTSVTIVLKTIDSNSEEIKPNCVGQHVSRNSIISCRGGFDPCLMDVGARKTSVVVFTHDLSRPMNDPVPFVVSRAPHP